jgi:hypothetical protein
MFRVVFRLVPDECPSDEVYDYLLSHALGGAEVVNALRLKSAVDIGDKTSGAVIVDYASRSAAEAALRESLVVNGVVVSGRMLGAVHVERPVSINSSKPPVILLQKRKREVSGEVSDSRDDRLLSVGEISVSGTATYSSDHPQEVSIGVRHLKSERGDAALFADLTRALQHHGGALQGLCRVSSTEANLTVFATSPSLLLLSLFGVEERSAGESDAYGQQEWGCLGSRRAAVDLLDPSFTPIPVGKGGQADGIEALSAVIFFTPVRSPLDTSAFSTRFRRLDGASAGAVLARSLSRLSEGRAVLCQDDFGNVLLQGQ